MSCDARVHTHQRSRATPPGRSMNKGTPRGEAQGFDLCVLRSMMSIKRPARGRSGAEVTLMHYLCELLRRRGIGSEMLRCQLRHAVDGACTDLDELAREVSCIEADAQALETEVEQAQQEISQSDDAVLAIAMGAEAPPLEGSEYDQALVTAFGAVRFHRALSAKVSPCNACAQSLRGKLEDARQTLIRIGACFGGELDGDARAKQEHGRSQLGAIVDFIAALEKAEKDNRRESKLADTLRKLEEARGHWNVSRKPRFLSLKKRAQSAPLPRLPGSLLLSRAADDLVTVGLRAKKTPMRAPFRRSDEGFQCREPSCRRATSLPYKSTPNLPVDIIEVRNVPSVMDDNARIAENPRSFQEHHEGQGALSPHTPSPREHAPYSSDEYV